MTEINEKYSSMRQNVKMLGNFLGQTINDVHGRQVLDLIEQIRLSSKDSYKNNKDSDIADTISELLEKISVDQLLPIARAFTHFLNLINIAEQYESTSKHYNYMNLGCSFDATLKKLKDHNIPAEKILSAINSLFIELVLTAHPTEVARRSLVHKHVEINKCLAKLDFANLNEMEIEQTKSRILQLIAQTWHTNEIRDQQPTPIDEAKFGFAMVENSLWDAVPKFLRNMESSIFKHFDKKLAVDFAPLKISSWMAGDRDGNPSVTAEITRQAVYTARYKAAELFYNDIQALSIELSISSCSDDFKTKYGEHNEPYRYVLKLVRMELSKTLDYYQALILGLTPNFKFSETIFTDDELWTPLYDCYQSLCDSSMYMIANGLLKDTLYRVKAFGVTLLKIDIRQDSCKHLQAISEITQYIGIGDFAQWSEQEKQEFLIKELNSNRPLIPRIWQPSADTQEVIDTFKYIATQPKNVINAYIISMTKQPSDILIVQLFFSEFNISHSLPVVPLFETLADLSNAKDIMQTLFQLDWYYKNIRNSVMVMIGYSDSAKDAGMMAASWAQYKCQEELIDLCEQYNVELTLFHGRGGTIGRGGAPAHEALLSQPPKSLKNGLRVTEQGEMIRFKLGFPEIAEETFNLYASAVLEANLLPPPKPKKNWQEVMNVISEYSCKVYKDVIEKDPNFIEYFKAITPSEELGKLPLSSRPAKRFASKGIEGLRAIPWIFAWTQNRLMLPSWLGVGESLQFAIDQGYKKDIDDMYLNWPFFNTRISLVEMVYSKINLSITQRYESKLMPDHLNNISIMLHEKVNKDIATVLSISNQQILMSGLSWIADSIAQRNIYTKPLNMLQIELLARIRNHKSNKEDKELLEKALMIVITGIAAGMRNTG